MLNMCAEQASEEIVRKLQWDVSRTISNMHMCSALMDQDTSNDSLNLLFDQLITTCSYWTRGTPSLARACHKLSSKVMSGNTMQIGQ